MKGAIALLCLLLGACAQSPIHVVTPSISGVTFLCTYDVVPVGRGETLRVPVCR